MAPERRRVLVSGMVAGVPRQGGATWAVLQWVLGLRQLGHDVVLVEPVDALTFERCRALERVARSFGLHGRLALAAPGGRTAGQPYGDLAAFAASADLVLNIAGMLRDPELLEPAAARVYLDLDPGFTQLWHEQGVDVGLAGHTHFVTVGLNLGHDSCPLPSCGMAWTGTLPPVVLDEWPALDGTSGAWTTVANWRGYGSVQLDGLRLGQKCHSWRQLFELPRLTGAPLQPAIAIHPGEAKDAAALDEHGWTVLAPVQVAGTPQAYRAFVQGSRGELGVAKEGYVRSRSGWFSDRSACYLASGRPVVAQETGWTDHLPSGEGLLAFSTAAEAAEALDQVEVDYRRHRRAARRLAVEHLDAGRVISRLLDRLHAPHPPSESRDPDAAAFATAAPICRLAARVLPPGATGLVVSKGDDQLLRLGPAKGQHFPQAEDGSYPGHHPAPGEVVALLEGLRARGAGFLLIPEWAMWWIDYYGDLRRHLDHRYALVAFEEGAGVIWSLARRPMADRARVTVRPGDQDGSCSASEAQDGNGSEIRALELSYKRPIEFTYALEAGRPHVVRGELVGTEVASGRAALLAAEFLDGEGAPIPGPYRHLARSPREEIGWYSYLPTREGAGTSPFATLMEPPEGAASLRARFLKCDRKLPDRLFLAAVPTLAPVDAAALAAWVAEAPDDIDRLRLLARLQAAEGELSAQADTLRRIAQISGTQADGSNYRRAIGALRELDTRWSPSVPGRTRPAPSARGVRICHLFKVSCPFESSGGAVRNLNTVKSQKEAGLDPYVVTPLGYPATHGATEFGEEEEVEGVLHVRLPLPGADDRALPLDRRLSHDALATAAVIRSKGADVIHAASGFRGYELALKGLGLARHFELPLVYEVRSLHEHLWGSARLERKLEREWTQLRLAQENRCMAEADAVVTLGSAMRRLLVDRGVPEEKIWVVPNAVDVDRFRPAAPDPDLKASLGLPPESVVVGYVSNISYREGHDVLVRAFAEASRDHPDLRCLLVGDGPERANVEHLARTLGIGNRLVTTGEIDHRDVIRYYSMIDVFVVPRRPDYASDSVTPLKPFEAMALERALVVADLPSLREVVGDGDRGLLFRPEDSAELADCIGLLAARPDLRRELGTCGREWIMRGRTWAANASRYRELYEALLETTVPRRART